MRRRAFETGSWRTQTPQYAKHLAPCSAWCPAGNDVIGFVQTLARDGEAAAFSVLARSTPFPIWARVPRAVYGGV